ncbi:MAG: FAD-binding protein [Woeseia sp.]
MHRRRFCQSVIGAAVATSIPAAQSLGTYLQLLTTVSGDIDVITGSGGQIILRKAAVQDLSDSLRGRLLLPGNEGYEKARRVLNRGIDKHPALVVQPTGVADVRSAVDFARDNELLLAVKCGGHSFSSKSTCDGGMQIDLAGFRGVRIDPASRTAYVDGGSLLGGLDHEAMALGLVTTTGTVSHTGVGGLTLGGGFGRLARRFGLALDNVKAVDIVTPDDGVRAIDYVALQRSSDNTDPRNDGQYMKSGFTGDISNRLVDAIVEGFEPRPERGTMLFFQQSGGAIGRVETDATAFAHRYSEANLFIIVNWPLDFLAEPHLAYIRRFWAELEPHTRGYYTNEVADEAQSNVHANYQGNFERLLALKKKYDPGNLFRLNANIDPTV